MMKDLKGMEEINEQRYLERYRARSTAVDLIFLFPVVSDDFLHYDRANRHALIYAKSICQLTRTHILGSFVLTPFVLRHGIHDFSLHVSRVRTSIGAEGQGGRKGFRLVPSLPTRHRFSIVECGPGAVTNLMKLFSV